MIVTDHDIDVAARTVWGEARGEPWAGKVAVAWVIKNRAEDSRRRYGQGLAGVCQKPLQFSCWNQNDANRPKMIAVTDMDLSFRECLAAMAWAIDGLGGDPTMGAMHYQVTGTNAVWAAGHTPVVTIGSHQFYVHIDG
jgi:spore germination cell wall hydrolase CwlJ-like protein